MDPKQTAQQPTQQPPIPQDVPSQAVPSQKNPMSKIPLIFLGIIVLAGVAGGSYYLGMQKSQIAQTSDKKMTNEISLTPSSNPTITSTLTPNPTANWQTYTNTKYAYSVKYPQGLTSNEVNKYYHYVEFKVAIGSLPKFLVSVIPDNFVAKNIAAYNYMSSDWIGEISNTVVGQSKTMDSGAKYTRLMDMIVDGVDSVSIKVEATGYKQVRTYAKKNGYIYMLSNYYQADEEFEDYTLFVSSFKFTQ